MQNKFLFWFQKLYVYIILALIYIPLIVIIFLSFTTPSAKGNITNGFNWNSGENYLNLFTDSQFTNALVNTIIISIIVVPVSTIIATLTCFGIWNSKKFYQNAVIGLSKTNIVIPDIITGITLALLFSITWINIFKANLGFATIILSHISFCTPYAIIIIFPRMQKMNRNLILASLDLGYSKIITFFKITLPFLLPAILSGAAIVFGISFDDFIITKLVGGKINTISSEMYSMAKGIKAWAVTFGSIIILATFTIIAIIGIKKIISEKQKKTYKVNKKWLRQRKNI